jgi:hypothetical protein
MSQENAEGVRRARPLSLGQRITDKRASGTIRAISSCDRTGPHGWDRGERGATPVTPGFSWALTPRPCIVRGVSSRCGTRYESQVGPLLGDARTLLHRLTVHKGGLQIRCNHEGVQPPQRARRARHGPDDLVASWIAILRSRRSAPLANRPQSRSQSARSQTCEMRHRSR